MGPVLAERVRTPDGRTVEYCASAPPTPDGAVLVFHHGQPGAAVIDPALAGAAGRYGLPVVTLSRPGYGASIRQPGRRVAAAAADVAAVLDHLGAGPFVTAGWSGGGPHALACGALLAPRCRAAASLAGVAPYLGADDLDWTAGMGPENVAEFEGIIAGDPGSEEQIRRLCAELAAIEADGVAEALGGLISEPDRDVLESGAAALCAESFRRSAMHGHYGYWDDSRAFLAPWGFSPGSLDVPVQVWYAGRDLMVPPSHGRWLADRIPGAERIELDGEGHISLVANHVGDIVGRLVHAGGLGVSARMR